MAQYICIDIGGTIIKFGIAEEAGTLLHRAERRNPIRQEGLRALLDLLLLQIQAYKDAYPVCGIAVSTAGIVDEKTGMILFAGKAFPGYTGFPLGSFLQSNTGLPCRVENDVNCAGLGEFWLGAGRGMPSIFCLTVGTGIGGCVILDGHLLRGASHSAGEIGYLHMQEKGTFEELASTTRLVAEVAREKNCLPEELDGKQIFAWAKAGDAVSIAAIDRQVFRLAEGISNICYVLNPACMILGGGMMAQEEYLRPRLEKALSEYLLPGIYQHTQLAFAQLKNDAGMLGALYHFLQAECRDNKEKRETEWAF